MTMFPLGSTRTATAFLRLLQPCVDEDDVAALNHGMHRIPGHQHRVIAAGERRVDVRVLGLRRELLLQVVRIRDTGISLIASRSRSAMRAVAMLTRHLRRWRVVLGRAYASAPP
jgi:hypothetical protein